MTKMTPECQWCGMKLGSWDEPHDLVVCLQEKLANAEARIEALEGHEAEFKWLLTHDSGDVGGIGRRQWIERRDALLPELTALPAEEKTHG